MQTLLFAAIAAATNMVAELPPVVVYASRVNEQSANLPQNVQVITADEIAQSGAHDVADLLSKVAPSVSLSHLGGKNPALTQISMGGYGENGFGRTLVLVDGERLNNPDMAAPNLAQVSLSSIKQIEILSGPQTVLHGDGASAGMINIVTEPDDYERHSAVEAHVGNWGTAGASFVTRGGIEEDGLIYWGGAAYDHSDGYRENSGFDIWNANGGIRKNWSNGSWLKVSAFYNDSTYDLPGPLTRNQWHSNPRDSFVNHQGKGYYRRSTYGLHSTLNVQLNDENALRLIGSVSRRHSQSRSTGSGMSYYPPYAPYTYAWEVDYDMYSYEFTPEWINTSDVFGLENELIVGSTFRLDRNDAASATTYSYGYVYPARGRVTRQNMGFFAQDTLHLTEQLAVQLGGRYERVWLKDTGYNAAASRASDMFAYDAGLLFKPVDDFKTYVRFSRFFRSPFVDEFSYTTGSAEVLSPETGWMADVGADWSFIEEFFLGGNLYYSKLKHEIFYNPLAFSNMNAPSDTVREGLNLRVGWSREKVAGVQLAYSLVHAEFDGGAFDGNEVPMVPEQTVSLTGRVYLWDDCFVFGGYRYQTAQWAASDFANNGGYAGSRRLGRIPDFGLFHIGVEYAPTFADWIRGVKVGFTVDNLFDKDYCDYATYGVNYWPGAGRSYTLTLRYEF